MGKIKKFIILLKPLQDEAVRRANKRIEQLENEHIEIISRQSNPATTVAKLVEYLNSKK